MKTVVEWVCASKLIFLVVASCTLQVALSVSLLVSVSLPTHCSAPPPPLYHSPPHFLDALTLPPAFSDDNYGNHNNLAAGAYLTQFVVQLLSCSVVQLVSAAFLYPASCYYCHPGKFAFNEKPKSAAAADARNLPALAVRSFSCCCH